MTGDIALLPGPCECCGDVNYLPSLAGPTVCPSCDLGYFGPDVVRRQGEKINQLRGRIEQLVAERAGHSIPSTADYKEGTLYTYDTAAQTFDPLVDRRCALLDGECDCPRTGDKLPDCKLVK